MPRISFTFSYQAFTRYVRDNCDSEQEVDRDRVTEKWLYNNMDEYLQAHRSRVYDLQWEKYTPEEFRTGKAGAPKRLDLVGYSLRNPRDQLISLIIEAKLMVDDNRPWAQEIITDILRVASVQSRTNRRTQRYIMVVGQERCWAKVKTQLGGMLPEMCPMDRGWNLLRRVFGERPKWTSLNEAWRKRAGAAVEEYLVPLIPSDVGIELVGRSVSKRESYEEPTVGISARLWRISPRGCPVPVRKAVGHETAQQLEPAPVPVSVPQSE